MWPSFCEGELELLRADNCSGAAEIERRAAALLVRALEAGAASAAPAAEEWLLALARRLMDAQPAMAGLFRLCSDLLWACRGADGSPAVCAQGLAYLRQREVEEQHSAALLEVAALSALQPYGVLLTCSRSSTVLRALRALARTGRRVRMFCGEGRPMNEGVALARELAEAGVGVTLGVDMALFGWLGEAEALVIGADAISPAGVVNKLGTAPLVAAAAERGLPRIVLCGESKLVPAGYPLRGLERGGDEREILNPPRPTIHVRNAYFDLTPLSQVSLVVSQRGALQGEALAAALERIHLYPGLGLPQEAG